MYIRSSSISTQSSYQTASSSGSLEQRTSSSSSSSQPSVRLFTGQRYELSSTKQPASSRDPQPSSIWQFTNTSSSLSSVKPYIPSNTGNMEPVERTAVDVRNIAIFDDEREHAINKAMNDYVCFKKTDRNINRTQGYKINSVGRFPHILLYEDTSQKKIIHQNRSAVHLNMQEYLVTSESFLMSKEYSDN